MTTRDLQQDSQTRAAWFQQTTDTALEELDSSQDGLSAGEAKSRLEQYGRNTIRSERKVSAWTVLLHQFASPLVYVLIVTLGVTVAIQSWGDATVIGLVLIVNATIGFFQEYRAESAVQSLMEMVSPKAQVRRDGKVRKIEAELLVPGDCVILEEGDMVPADLRVLQASSLQVNESALTGESVPVSKRSDAQADDEERLPPAEQHNMVFMGTAVTAGHGEAIVVATGAETQLGQIAEDVREAGDITTPLQQRMNRLARAIAVIIVLLALVAFGVGRWMGRSTEQMFLLAVSLSVAAIPAGLPVVMTVALAIGVRRMANQNAVIRHLSAVETLGSTTCILSDKTGTLTQNLMTVTQIAAGSTIFKVTGDALTQQGQVQHNDQAVDPHDHPALLDTLLAGTLNNTAKLVRRQADGESHQGDAEDSKADNSAEGQSGASGRSNNKESQTKTKTADREDVSETQNASETEAADAPEFEIEGDPMEAALLLAGRKAGFNRDDLLQQYPQVDEVPFETEKRFSASIHEVSAKNGDGEQQRFVFIKGAPEAILQMCSQQKNGNGEVVSLNRSAIEEQHQQLTSSGLRVLAMATGSGDTAVKSIQSSEPSDMTFVGLQGLLDPPRPAAVQAVDDCHNSGIRVMMVTGDHAGTASAIAGQVHLDRPVAHSSRSDQQPTSPNSSQGDGNGGSLEVVTGTQLATASDSDVDQWLDRVNVFARVKPDQKMRLVNRLKSAGQVVAVTGDGVNDAPALKAAHLGAAMGESGTDVAKEASDMVITDDNFASVYAAVRQGRTAFRNIRMATFFLLSTGMADVLIILSALALRWELPLLPAQILWCNVVTNGIADVALGFEPGEQALYSRAPRPLSEGVLDRMLLERLVLVGIWLSLGTLGIFWWVNSYRGEGLELARVAALTTLVLFQMVHVFNCRSENVSLFRKNPLQNKVLLVGVLASLGIHIGALYLPWTQQLLRLQPLPGRIWLAAIAVGATAILVNELHKWLRPREKFSHGSGRLSRWFSFPRDMHNRLDRIEKTVQQNQSELQKLRPPRHEDRED